MLTNQSTGLGTQLEYRKTWGIVDIQRCAQQLIDVLIQSLPLVTLQLSVQNLRTLNLTGIRDQSVNQLNVRHL